MTRDDLLTLSQRLREYNHNPHHINPVSDAFHKLITESAEALSQFAAIQGGMGEVIEPCADLNHHERYRAGWNACLAQHQRITAAMAAEVERKTASRDKLAAILRDLVPGCKWRIMRPRIDAALLEIENGDQ